MGCGTGKRVNRHQWGGGRRRAPLDPPPYPQFYPNPSQDPPGNNTLATPANPVAPPPPPSRGRLPSSTKTNPSLPPNPSLLFNPSLPSNSKSPSSTRTNPSLRIAIPSRTTNHILPWATRTTLQPTTRTLQLGTMGTLSTMSTMGAMGTRPRGGR
jgi:hypothetical protein